MYSRFQNVRLASRLGSRVNGRSRAVFRLLPGGPAATLCGAGQLGGSFGETLTCTRASAKYAENGSGILTALTNNQPAVEPKGLLVEAAATNLLLRSAEINTNGAGAPWYHSQSGSSITVTANAAVAPDGNTTAEQVAYGATTDALDYSVVSQGVAATNATAYTVSIWARMASGTGTIYLCATPDGSTFAGRTACALTTTWQRFSLTFTASSTATWYFQTGVDRRDAQQSGQAAQTVYLWGAQYETGSFASSYIATAGTTATRVVDTASVSTSNFPIAAGTVEFDAVPSWGGTPAATRVLFDTRKAAATDDGVVAYIDTSRQLNFLVDGASATTITSAALTWTAGTRYRVCAIWGHGNLYLYRDEVLVASNTTGTRPMPAQHSGTCWLGSDYSGANQFYGHISNFSVRR